MLTPYQFASNSPIDGIDLDGLERVHYSYGTEKLTTGEVVPVLNFLGVQKSREVQVSTIFGMFGWNPTVSFPLEKEVVVHAATENGSNIGYRFSNLREAFGAAKNQFEGIDRFDPSKTTNAEEMQLNNFEKNASSIGQIGIVTSSVGFQKGLSNLQRKPVGTGGNGTRLENFSKIPKASELRNWAKNQNYELLSNRNGIETWGLKETDGWRLKMKQPSTTPGIDSGSQKFRYSARSKPGEYLDPTTGKTGTRGELGHQNLDPD